MKILITGGAGFIGSAVIRLAIARGHSVINLDALTYSSCIENLADIKNYSNYCFEKVNILDMPKLSQIFKKHSPDAVIHLAAESHVDRSIDNPSDFILTNVNGTFNLLETARNYWQQNGMSASFRFHHVSTDEVFGSLPKNQDIKFNERTRYNPRSPYAASKASSDQLVLAWHETYGLPVCLTNCSNNYGPYQFPEKLIPVTIINALLGKPLPIYGEGKNVRDWLHVEDHAAALLLVLERGVIGRQYVIGGEAERTNLELVEAICAIMDRLCPKSSGSHKDMISFVKDRPGHDLRYAIDARRIRNDLGWAPSMSLAKGMEKTVMWYLSNEHWWRSLQSRPGVGQRLGLKSG